MTKFTIPILPRPKQRPRYSKGHAYTPKETREYEEIIGYYARQTTPLRGALRICINFYMPIPKSWSKAMKMAAERGEIRPALKPDIDNLAKAVLDGMNKGVAYNDDSQVVELVCNEWYGDPRTEVEIKEL